MLEEEPDPQAVPRRQGVPRLPWTCGFLQALLLRPMPRRLALLLATGGPALSVVVPGLSRGMKEAGLSG